MSVPKLITTSIAKVVRDLIDEDLSMQDSLQRGYGNVSAISRLLRAQIRASLGREVKLGTIITSVKRVKLGYGKPGGTIGKVVAASSTSVRTDVAKLSIERTKRTLNTVRRVLAEHTQEFLHVSEGISAITMLVDQQFLNVVKERFDDEEVLEEERDLAAIFVHSPQEIIGTPGCALAFLNQVSRRHINIQDVVSCYTDTIIVIDMKDVGKAFAALADIISDARKGEKGT